MDPSAKFWDRIANRYSRQPVKDEATYQKKLEVTRTYLRPDMEVWEFGCGTGSTAIAHGPYVKHIHATDISPRMIEIAQGKAEAAHIENVTFECAATNTSSIPNQSLDAVMGHNILHLVADWQEVITQVHKILKPDGVFVTSTACVADMAKIFKVIAPVGRALRLIPLVKVFTAKELEARLIDAGFVIDYKWQPGKNKAVFMVAKKAT